MKSLQSTTPDRTVSNKIRLAKGITIPPLTQTHAPVSTETGGLCFLQNHPKLALKDLALMASGVTDILSNTLFRILLSNFSNKTVRLPKNTVIGLALSAPAGILNVTDAAEETASSKEGGETVTEASSSGTTKKDWKEDVHLSVEDEKIRKRVFSMLEEFEDMWSGRLGEIAIAEHRI